MILWIFNKISIEENARWIIEFYFLKQKKAALSQTDVK